MNGEGHYLGGGAVELLQAVLQPLHLCGEVFTPLTQQTAIQLDLLQERLGRGVIVAPLVSQVLLGLLVDTHVDVGHEFTDRLLHLGLQQMSIREKLASQEKRIAVQKGTFLRLNVTSRTSGLQSLTPGV